MIVKSVKYCKRHQLRRVSMHFTFVYRHFLGEKKSLLHGGKIIIFLFDARKTSFIITLGTAVCRQMLTKTLN